MTVNEARLRFETGVIHSFFMLSSKLKVLHGPRDMFFTLLYAYDDILSRSKAMDHNRNVACYTMAQSVLGHATVSFLSFDPHTV